LRESFDFISRLDYADGMFRILSQKTIRGWGLKDRKDVQYSGLAVWDELSKGRTSSDIVGRALIKVAVKVVNDHFKTKPEWILNQPEIVEYVVENLHRTISVGGKLLTEFPSRPADEESVVKFIYTRAKWTRSDIVKKMVNRESIATEQSYEGLSGMVSDDADQTTESVSAYITKRNSEIIKEEIEKSQEKRGVVDLDTKLGGHIEKKFTNPEERLLVEERLAEKLEEVKRKGQRVSQRLEEAIARAEETRVMLGMDRKFYSFPSVDEMVLGLEDLMPLDDYYFVYVPKDVKLDKSLYPEEDEGWVEDLSDMELGQLKKRLGGEDAIIGFPLFDGVSVSLSEQNAAGMRLYEEAEKLNGLKYETVHQLVDLLQIEQLQKAHEQRDNNQNM